MELRQYIEHTLLKPDAKKEELDKLFDEAKKYGFLGVCVNPINVEYAKKQLEGSGVKIVTVVGFPLGASLSADVISRKSMNLGVSLSVDNIADKVYCNHLSRLKYIGDGYCDMGRNFTLKISLRL